MIIKLPGMFAGSRIVEAFLSANSHQLDDEHEWRVVEFVGEYQYELKDSVQKSALNKGAIAHKFFLKRKSILFSDKVWKKDCNLTFRLCLVILDHEYDQIDVEIDVFQNGTKYIAINPHHSGFKAIEPQLKDMLNRFIFELNS